MFRISRTLRSNLGSQNLNMCRKMQRHYQVLGIDPSQIATLTEQQIREAYLKAIQTSHPDVGGSTAAFLQVRESYRLVSNNYRQMSNPTAQHFPATLTEEEQREEQERWARAEQDAIRAMHRWILWKLLVWLTGIGFMLYVIYVCRASLNQNSNRAAQTYSEKPVRFTLTKEQAYDADAMFPEYSEWKARRNEEVERQMEGLRQLRSKYKDQNTTYAVRWRGQPYSADAMMLEGVRRNLRDSKLKGESEIHEDTADLTEELDEDVVT